MFIVFVLLLSVLGSFSSVFSNKICVGRNHIDIKDIHCPESSVVPYFTETARKQGIERGGRERALDYGPRLKPSFLPVDTLSW